MYFILKIYVKSLIWAKKPQGVTHERISGTCFTETFICHILLSNICNSSDNSTSKTFTQQKKNNKLALSYLVKHEFSTKKISQISRHSSACAGTLIKLPFLLNLKKDSSPCLNS